MKKYVVEIQATVRKTYTVEAGTRFEASEKANEIFSILNEKDVDEHYDQEILSIEEVK